MTTTPLQVMPAHVVKSLDEWAAAIHADLDGAAQGLLSAGRHLMEAKVEHPGTFRAWLDSGGAGIKKSFAYMLMKIAEHPVSNMLDKVPSADVVSLYQLARLEPAQLEAAVEMDAVTPEMSRSEVKQYVDREMTHSKIKSRQQKTRDELEEITTYGKDAFVKAFNGGAFAGGITVDDFADKVLRRLSEDPDAAPTQEPGAFDPVKLGEAILKSVRPAQEAPAVVREEPPPATEFKVDGTWSDIPEGAAWRCEGCGRMFLDGDAPRDDDNFPICSDCHIYELGSLAEVATEQWENWVDAVTFDSKDAVPFGLIPYLSADQRQKLASDLGRDMSILASVAAALGVS